MWNNLQFFFISTANLNLWKKFNKYYSTYKFTVEQRKTWKRKFWDLTWLFIASHKRIASQGIWTTTDWRMIDNFARSIASTRIDAGIRTSLTNTCFIKGAIWICNAFWTAIWGRTNVILFAWTNSLPIVFFTSWVETTGRWWTWVLILLNNRYDKIQWIVEFIWLNYKRG